MSDIILPDWPAPKNIHAFTTTKHGGVSAGHYASFNLGAHCGDDAEHVKQNREILIRQYGLPSEPVWLKQVHGNVCVKAHTILNSVNPHALSSSSSLLPSSSGAIAEDPKKSDTMHGLSAFADNDDREKLLSTSNQQKINVADASYSLGPNTVCAVLTADCLPILIYSNSKTTPAVAAIHAGWRGIVAGIIPNTIKQLTQAGINPCDLNAWLAPAISANAYEVDSQVYQAFIKTSPEINKAFSAPFKDNKYLLDLYQAATIQLQNLGVNKTYGGKHCTYQDEKFYSYRRDQTTGRQASLIWFE